MKKLILLGAFLMLCSITNNGFAQTTSADLEATIISISPDKRTGHVYSSTLGSVIEFVNETLVDVLPGDKVLIIAPPREISDPGQSKQITTSEGPRYIVKADGVIY